MSFEDKLTDETPKNLTELWPQFLDHMLKDRPNLGTFLSSGYVSSCTEMSIDIKFPPACRFQFMEVTKKHNRDEIELLLRQFTSRIIELHIAVDNHNPDSEKREFLKQIGKVSSTINDEIENEPIIQTVLDMFDGEVLN